jgi:hypothetical protein
VKFLLPEESPRKSSLGDSYTQLFAQPIAINTSINLPELYEISEAYVIDPHYLTDYEDLTQDDRQH